MLLARIAQLEERVAALEARFGPRDRADLNVLLAIADIPGTDDPFTSRRLLSIARANPPNPLADAFDAADVVNTLELGHLLRRLEGQAVEGRVLEQVERVRAGRRWRLVRR